MPNPTFLALEAFDGTVVMVSIVLVFAMLVALCLIIMLEGRFFDRASGKAAEPAPAPAPNPPPSGPGSPGSPRPGGEGPRRARACGPAPFPARSWPPLRRRYPSCWGGRRGARYPPRAGFRRFPPRGLGRRCRA